MVSSHLFQDDQWPRVDYLPAGIDMQLRGPLVSGKPEWNWAVSDWFLL